MSTPSPSPQIYRIQLGWDIEMLDDFLPKYRANPAVNCWCGASLEEESMSEHWLGRRGRGEFVVRSLHIMPDGTAFESVEDREGSGIPLWKWIELNRVGSESQGVFALGFGEYEGRPALVFDIGGMFRNFIVQEDARAECGCVEGDEGCEHMTECLECGSRIRIPAPRGEEEPVHVVRCEECKASFGSWGKTPRKRKR